MSGQEQSLKVITLLLLEKRTRKLFNNSKLWMAFLAIALFLLQKRTRTFFHNSKSWMAFLKVTSLSVC